MKKTKRNVALSQMRALFLKQLTLQLRQKKTLLCQMLFPVVMMLLLFALVILIRKLEEKLKHPPKPTFFYPFNATEAIPRGLLFVREPLSENKTKEYPYRFLFTTSNSGKILSKVGYLGPDGQSDGLLSNIRQYPSNGKLYEVPYLPYAVHQNNTEEINDLFLSLLRNSTLDGYYGSIEFSYLQYNSSMEGVGISYIVQAPTSCEFFHYFAAFGDIRMFCKHGFIATLINTINNAFIKSLLGANAFQIEASFEQMPYLDTGFHLNMDVSSAIIHLILLFPIPMFIMTVLLEKTTKIREMMKLNGMKMKYYWLIYCLMHGTIYLLFTCTLIYICTFAFQIAFSFANPLLIIVFFIACCISVLGLCIFLASIINNVLLGVILGYLIALFIPSVAGQINTYIIAKTGNKLLFLLLFPPFAIECALTSGIIEPCTNFNCPTLKSFLTWNGYSTGVLFMIADGILYMLLGFYLDAVLPREWGIRKHPLFFLKPVKNLIQFFFSRSRKLEQTTSETKSLLSPSHNDTGVQNEHEAIDIDAPNIEEEDPDVIEERKREEQTLRSLNFPIDEETTLDQGSNPVKPIIIHNLTKFYGAHLAVQNLSLVIESGTCFGLLGPNGAGKTTTCNILCGLIEPSSGTAFINGYDIRTDIDMVHRSMGLAPQHEVLYDDLTVEEHVLFYCRLKGVPRSEEKASVEYILQSVGLDKPEDRRKRAKQLSGGMRRRLSLAMALCGDPAIILCDEPTTGLDPSSRRHIWSVIQKQKEEGRCIILTTHLLDEADVLCDRIGIIKTKLLCVGSPFHLKEKYGDCYRLTVNYNVKDRPSDESERMIEQFVKKNICPTAKLTSHYVGNLIIEMQVSQIKVDISTLFSLIEDFKAETVNLIEEYDFSQTTLEDVFFNITEKEATNSL